MLDLSTPKDGVCTVVADGQRWQVGLANQEAAGANLMHRGQTT